MKIDAFAWIGALAGAGGAAYLFWWRRGKQFLPPVIPKPQPTGSTACAAFDACVAGKAGQGPLIAGLALVECSKHLTTDCQKAQAVALGTKYANDLKKYLRAATT